MLFKCWVKGGIFDALGKMKKTGTYSTRVSVAARNRRRLVAISGGNRNARSVDVAPLKLALNEIRNLLIKLIADNFTKLMRQHKEIKKIYKTNARAR